MADASISSFFANIFGGENNGQERLLLADTNSQNMPLLQAVPNSDPNAGRGGGDIVIVGDEALFSENGPSGTVADLEEGHSDGKIETYVVKKGDSLSVIANMFGVSVNTIIWANDIKNSSIREGQSLIILPISGIKHKIRQGDTLNSVVLKYKGDIEEVLQYNNLDLDSTLVAGQEIIIPNGQIQIQTDNTKNLNSKIRGASGPSYAGYYIRPIEGGRKSQGIHGYNAVDLAAPIGTPIFASASGKIIVSKNYGWNGGYGNYVVIEHPNKTQTVYGHMSENITFEGQYVEQGKVIGAVGSTGRSTGPHIHFEIRGAKNPF